MPMTRHALSRFNFVGAILFVLALILGACSDGPRGSEAGPVTHEPGTPFADYRLNTGDAVRVDVFGEEDLSGEFQVDAAGGVAMPLVGQVSAAGLTVPEFEANLRKAIGEDYIRDPKVSAQVVRFRPFYILGEVMKSGEYPYFAGMNALNAIAIAGGYTYRADEDRIYVSRGESVSEVEFPASPATKLLPGDIVRVPERFF